MRLLDVSIHPVSPEQLVAIIASWGAGAAQRKVYNVNVHAMNLAAKTPDFQRALQGADLVFCDGFGVKWGARIAGVAIPYRMTPPDWIDAFAAACARTGQTAFALGDEAGVAEKFQAALAARNPGYRAAGAHHGFFAKDGPENDAVVAAINASGATHLLVGFGMPLQERWIEANAHRLNAKVFLPVGALFRWYIGAETRAPKWMTDNGLEWLGRFMQHPVRHFERYAVGNPAFLWRAFKGSLKRGA